MTKRPTLAPMSSVRFLSFRASQCPGCPASGGQCVAKAGCVGRRGVCTHGHSRAGFRSKSGWGGRSWWWSPEAGNLSDSGRALCFPPVARTEGPTITSHAATLHTHHSVTYFPMTQLLLRLAQSYLSSEAAYIIPLPHGRAQHPHQCSYGTLPTLLLWAVPDSESEEPDLGSGFS